MALTLILGWFAYGKSSAAGLLWLAMISVFGAMNIHYRNPDQWFGKSGVAAALLTVMVVVGSLLRLSD